MNDADAQRLETLETLLTYMLDCTAQFRNCTAANDNRIALKDQVRAAWQDYIAAGGSEQWAVSAFEYRFGVRIEKGWQE